MTRAAIRAGCLGRVGCLGRSGEGSEYELVEGWERQNRADACIFLAMDDAMRDRPGNCGSEAPGSTQTRSSMQLTGSVAIRGHT